MACTHIKKIEECMRSEKIGIIPHIFLSALSFLYGAAVSLRLMLFRIGVLKEKKLDCGVISVGNLTVGGTGKTPVTIYLADLLRRHGKRVVILSRGYKGSSKGVGIVSDGREILLGPEEAGDEPYLMAKRLNDVPVLVSPDRYASGLLAIERFSPDWIILDDGFQHIGLKRDVNILLVDSKEGFGNGYMLPRGILREPVIGLGRADLVMAKGNPLRVAETELLEDINMPLVNFEYRAGFLIEIGSGNILGMDFLKGKKVAALSGIANPSSFFKTLELLGAEIVNKLIYPDHHAYAEPDIEEIRKTAKEGGVVITTEKDCVKLKGFAEEGRLPIYALSIDVYIGDADEFEKLLFSAMEGRL